MAAGYEAIPSPTGSPHLVFARNVPSRVVSHQCGGDQADHRADGDIDRDWGGRTIGRVQPGGDQRRGSASDDGGKLVAERGAAIAQPARKAFGDQCSLRTVLHVVWN